MGKLFYGTMTGNTSVVAETIQTFLPELIQEVKCVDKAKADEIAACDFLVFGGSTWGDGELTDDWADFLPQLDRIDLSGKKVALFALGDQVGYTYNFVSAMREIYNKVVERGGEVVANCIPTEGFDFSHSESVVDGKFVGLVIDEVNEPNLTNDRIQAWADLVPRRSSSSRLKRSSLLLKRRLNLVLL